MAPVTAHKLKLSLLVLSLLFLFTWGVLTALMLIDNLPGYIKVV